MVTDMDILNKDIFSEKNSQLFNLLKTPLWIYDMDNLKMYWANDAAVEFWKKKDLDDLLNSDLTDISLSTRYRLKEYSHKFQNNETIYDQWTFYPDNKPVTIDCICRGVRIEDNRIALFIEGNIKHIEKIEENTIRGVEVIRHTPVIVSLYTLDGKILMQNPSAVESYNNLTLNNNIKGFSERFVDVTEAQNAIDYLMKNKVYKSEVQIYTSKGIRWHEINAAITNDPVLGDPVILVNELNITERKNAENSLKQSEKKFKSFFENATIGLAIQTINGKYIQVNKAICNIFGYTEGEMLSKSVQELSHPEELEVDKKYLSDFLDGTINTFEREKKYINKSGETIWANISVSILRNSNDSPLYFISQVEDITKRKWAENEIIKMNEELEAKVNKQTAELLRSNEELQQFAYVASHDIQEPLRMVTGYIQLLQKRYKDKLDDNANEYIGFAVDGVKRMQSMLLSILDYSRVGTKGKELKDTDFNKVVESVKSNLSLLIKENDVDLTYENLPVLKSDISQMIQLFQNLISNSIKYRSDEKLHIHISAKCENNFCTFYLKDNGIGIEEQYFSRIFTIFQRLHTRNEYSGNGIGLAICKKIVERHGGTITVESQIGEGSTFIFTIPC